MLSRESNSDVIEITFSSDRAVLAKCSCRVCHNPGGTHYLDVFMRDQIYELYECLHCGSLYYDGINPAKNYADVENIDKIGLDYIQSGAGISSMLTPLFALDPVPAGNLLDVGSGFGFVVNYWSSKGLQAIGLEPSPYGIAGREMLKIDVRAQYLEQFLIENPNLKFNIVFSSEVIEHSPNPDEFVGLLLEALKPDGTIVITTPNIQAIGPDVDKAAMIAALSPGFHYSIISPAAIEQLFKRRGIHCYFEQLGNQTLCWASRHPLRKIDTSKFKWIDYFDYLSSLKNNNNKHLSTGALSRLFKDALNTGHSKLADEAYTELRLQAQKQYDIDIENPEINELMVLTEPQSGLEHYPSWLGGALLFGALHVGHSRNDRHTKLRMLDAAIKVLFRRSVVDEQFGQEAAHFLPFAKRQFVIALSEALTVALGKEKTPIQNDLRNTLIALVPVVTKFLQVP